MIDQRNHTSKTKPKRDYRVPAAVGVVTLLAAYGLYTVVSGDHSNHKRVVETVAIKMLPPPPEVKPPPPPPKIVEQPKIQQPIEKPQEPKPVDAPPPGPLALDAKGGPGSDSFGLGGKQGGSDFLASGNGTRGGHYAVMIINQVERRLHEDEKLDSSKFKATVKIWFSTAGKVTRVEVLHSTGDHDIDERIRQAVLNMPGLPEAFPQDLGPAIVRVGGRPNTES